MHLHVDHTGLIIDRQDLRPGGTGIGCLEQPPLGIVSPQPPQGSYIGDIGIGRVQRYSTDLEGLGEPHILPCGASIGRAIDSITPG
jgi:hypothetical protein